MRILNESIELDFDNGYPNLIFLHDEFFFFFCSLSGRRPVLFLVQYHTIHSSTKFANKPNETKHYIPINAPTRPASPTTPQPTASLAGIPNALLEVALALAVVVVLLLALPEPMTVVGVVELGARTPPWMVSGLEALAAWAAVL